MVRGDETGDAKTFDSAESRKTQNAVLASILKYFMVLGAGNGTSDIWLEIE